jgi:hypothetical protein
MDLFQAWHYPEYGISAEGYMHGDMPEIGDHFHMEFYNNATHLGVRDPENDCIFLLDDSLDYARSMKTLWMPYGGGFRCSIQNNLVAKYPFESGDGEVVLTSIGHTKIVPYPSQDPDGHGMLPLFYLVRVRRGMATFLAQTPSTHWTALEAAACSFEAYGACYLRTNQYRASPTIEISAGLLDRLSDTRISLSKEAFRRSPLISEGVVFNFQGSAQKKLDSMLSDGRRGQQSFFIFPTERGFQVCFSYEGMAPAGMEFCWDDMDDSISEKTLNKYITRSHEGRFTHRIGKSDIDMMAFNNFVSGGLSDIPEPTTDPKSWLPYMLKVSSHTRRNAIRYDLDCEQSDEKGYPVLSYSWDSKMFERCLVAVKLIAAYSDPQLRGEITVAEAKNKKGKGERKQQRKPSTPKWVWGAKKVRYISQDSAGGGGRSRHYVRPHMVSQAIKDVEKYAEYEPVPDPKRDGWHFVTIWRKGHWRGRSGEISLDIIPEYHTGKRARHYSLKAIRWLNSIMKSEGIRIRHARNEGELRVDFGDSYYFVDGFDPKTNTVYEFHGDVWHGNPDCFAPDECPHPYRKDTTARELYEETMTKKKVLEELGFSYVCIWENDWDS